MSKTITYDDYLRLVGLLTLAADHRAMLSAIERSACSITGDDPANGGHTSDAIWGNDYSARCLLELLGIPVPAPPTPTTTPEDIDRQMSNVMRVVKRRDELFPEEPS